MLLLYRGGKTKCVWQAWLSPVGWEEGNRVTFSVLIKKYYGVWTVFLTWPAKAKSHVSNGRAGICTIAEKRTLAQVVIHLGDSRNSWMRGQRLYRTVWLVNTSQSLIPMKKVMSVNMPCRRGNRCPPCVMRTQSILKYVCNLYVLINCFNVLIVF